jgi:hypothetical protein
MSGVWEPYETAVAEAQAKHPEWRTGQTHFNVLKEMRPDLAERVRGDMNLGPFYRVQNLLKFRAWVTQQWHDPPEQSYHRGAWNVRCQHPRARPTWAVRGRPAKRCRGYLSSCGRWASCRPAHVHLTGCLGHVPKRPQPRSSLRQARRADVPDVVVADMCGAVRLDASRVGETGCLRPEVGERLPERPATSRA